MSKHTDATARTHDDESFRGAGNPAHPTHRANAAGGSDGP